MKKSEKKKLKTKPLPILDRASKGFKKRKNRDQNSVSLLKEKAWKWFSLYVRLVDADDFGFVHCVTCGKKMHFREAQAGHFTPGRYKYILFDKRGCYPQCYRCNIELKSNPRKYDAYMRQKVGQEVMDELDRLSDISEPWTSIELKDTLQKYKPKALKEAQKRGLVIK